MSGKKRKRKARKNSDLRRELEHLLNRYSREQASNTPDFILARYLVGALEAYEAAVNARDRWHLCEHRPFPGRLVERLVELKGATPGPPILDELSTMIDSIMPGQSSALHGAAGDVVVIDNPHEVR